VTRRLLTAVVLLLAGLGTAVAAVGVHTLWWGLPLVVGGLVCALVAVGRGWSTRLPMALGFALGVGLAVTPSAEGGYLVSGGVSGWVLVLVAVVSPAWAVATLPRPRRVGKSAPVGPPT
jgi:hypothetical protein